MNKYKVFTTEMGDVDIEADYMIVGEAGELAFFLGGEADIFFNSSLWQLARRVPDETIPSNSPKEAPQG